MTSLEAGQPDQQSEAQSHEALGSVLVVGTGLIGTSVALALRAHGIDVHLSDRDPAVARQAADLGAGTLEPPQRQVDLAVVAVTPSATPEVVCALVAGNVAATVVDTAGVKETVLREVAAVIGEAPHFVGSHPMAGRERSGPGAARADLFDGRPWALTPAGSDPRSVTRVLSLIHLCGAVPVQLDAAAHDAAVALVSHLPQVAASLVAARLVDGGSEAVQLTGQGLRDVTRVAASDPGLWVDILLANAEPVAALLTALRADVDEVVAALDAARVQGGDLDGARAALREVMARGNAGRAMLPGKHGGRSTPYAVVPVVLQDRPGELGRLFAEVGAQGVNIEDLHIEHSSGQAVGLVELAVAPGEAAALGAALDRLGWVVHPSGA